VQWITISVMFICALSVCAPVSAQGLIFGDMTAVSRIHLDPDTDFPRDELEPHATLFYTGDFGRTKVLGEYSANKHDSHVGRAQLGWSVDSMTSWMGRMHNPTSYWRTRYHHGSYLQPTISRPAISEFEVDDGVLPAHITGVEFDGEQALMSGAVRYTATGGFGDKLDEDGLKAPDVFEGGRGLHDSSYALRLSWLPDPLASNEIGVYAGFNHIDSRVPGLDEVEQALAGFFINWDWRPLVLTSELIGVHNRANPGSDSGSFVSGYVQTEYSLTPKWGLNLRLENSWSNGDDDYLSQLNNFAEKRGLIGARYDFARNQALKFEFDHSRRQDEEEFSQFQIQWSFVFP